MINYVKIVEILTRLISVLCIHLVHMISSKLICPLLYIVFLMQTSGEKISVNKADKGGAILIVFPTLLEEKHLRRVIIIVIYDIQY